MLQADVIFQSYLDRMGQATMDGDFATYEKGVALPFNLSTETEEIIVSDRAELRKGFDDFYKTLQSQHVTDFVRTLTAHEARGDDLILGLYETNLLSDGKRVLPPWKSVMALARVDTGWRACWIRNNMGGRRWPLPRPFSESVSLDSLKQQEDS